MKLDFIHNIPDSIILCTISVGMLILLVYWFFTINSLRRQVELNQIQQEERSETILKHAREERQKDMETFFETHDVSCTCNQ